MIVYNLWRITSWVFFYCGGGGGLLLGVEFFTGKMKLSHACSGCSFLCLFTYFHELGIFL